MKHRENLLFPLLDYLACQPLPQDQQWRDWHIRSIPGGANNLLYRVTGPEGDLAVKFTIQDHRHRAEREFKALFALHRAGLPLAPRPILLEQRRYPQPVVVQSWLGGESLTSPPACAADWQAMLQHYATLHRLTPAQTDARLDSAVLNARSVAQGQALIRQQLAQIPKAAQPATLPALVHRLEQVRFPHWSKPALALCRVDANYLNFIRRPGLWASVDWENSGWGDPAFELAELMTHPAYLDVSQPQWEEMIQMYGRLSGEPAVELRVRVYYLLMLVWWVARSARYLYEVPRGLDKRLVPPPADWQANAQARYDHYLALAETHLGMGLLK